MTQFIYTHLHGIHEPRTFIIACMIVELKLITGSDLLQVDVRIADIEEKDKKQQKKVHVQSLCGFLLLGYSKEKICQNK
jgi:hypothetical protein